MNETANTPGKPYKYWAFISYSSKDRIWGQWLIKSIENYRVPKSLVGLKTSCGTIPSRLYPVFRDRDELRAGESVHEELLRALDQSRYLVVICSPNSANPDSWVNREISDFKSMGRERNVIALIVQGEPFSSNRANGENNECFPAALRYKVNSDGQLTSEPAEPLAADVTRENLNPRISRRKALLKIIARMIDVDFDTLEQRDRRRRRQKIAAWSAIGLSLTIAFGWLSALWVDATRISTSQELAKQSKEKLETEKDLSALLAVHAYHMHLTSAAYDALLTTVSENANILTFIHRGIGVSSIALNDNNTLIAVADCPDRDCRYREIHVYDVRTRQHAVKPIRIDAKSISEMAFHPQGKRLFVVVDNDEEHQLLALDLDKPSAPGNMLYRDRRSITNISISNDGRYYAVALKGGEFKVFDQQLGGRKCGDFVNGEKTEIAFSPNNSRLAISSEAQGRIFLVDLATCKSTELAYFGRLAAMSFGSKGKTLVTIMPDGTIRERSVGGQNESDRYHVSGYMLNGYLHAFSDDATLLASKHDNEIRVFDLAKRRSLKASLKDESLPGYAVEQINNDLKRLQVARLQGHVSFPRLFQFSKDGSLLASIDQSQVVILWDVKGISLVENQGQGSPYVASDINQTEASSVDNRFYATIREETEGCEGDYTLDCKRWLKLTLNDASTNLQIKTLVRGGDDSPGMEAPWIKFTDEGKAIVGRGESQQIWHIDLPYLVKQACRIANRSLTKAEYETYFGWGQWLVNDKSVSTCQGND